MSDRAHAYLKIYTTLSGIPTSKLQKYLTKSKSLEEFNRKCRLSTTQWHLDATCAYLEESGLSFKHLCTARQIVIREDKELTLKILRRVLLAKREHKCQKCDNTEWHRRPITLQVVHLNGKTTDNRDENLVLVCPNCANTMDL